MLAISRSEQTGVSRRRRLQDNRLVAVASVAVLIATLAVAGCGQTTPTSTGSSGTHTVATPASSQGGSTSPGVLPHFSDWRAVYLAPDGRTHIVTLDGKSDLSGPALPDLTSSGLIISSAGVGPDGKLLAYGTGDLDLVDLTGHTPPRSVTVSSGVNGLVWSPDGSKLYSYGGGGQFAYISLPSGHATNVTPGQGIADEVGWIDNTHLAATSFQGASYVTDSEGDSIPTSVTLDAVDLATDQVSAIATVQSNGPTFNFVVSPDGTQALYFNETFRDAPFTPQAAVINLSTGTVTPLPTIAETTGADFSAVAWRPGTQTLAVSTSYIENGNLKTWLIDVGADTATQIASTGYPVGWAPDNGPLVLSSGWQSKIGQGPYTLSAVTCAGATQCSGSATLTEKAMTFAFLGFMHNP
jgi:Tol biopolymer transport system component